MLAAFAFLGLAKLGNRTRYASPIHHASSIPLMTNVIQPIINARHNQGA